MAFEDILRGEAATIAKSRTKEEQSLISVLADLEKRSSELKSKYNAARQARERGERYTARNDDNYVCPSCWVEAEQRVALQPIPNKIEGHPDSWYRCPTCGQGFCDKNG